jgi:gas vesicle protein
MHNSKNNNEETYRGGNASGNLLYLLAGCGIGATLALLFAPKSGAELRSDISDITRKGYDETLELAHEMKERSAELYGSIKDHADKIYDLASEKLRLAENTIEESKGSVQELINGEIGGKSGKSSQKSAGGDRAPSNIY